VLQKVATLEELERHWSLDDVARANALLDMRDDIEDAEAQRIKT